MAKNTKTPLHAKTQGWEQFLTARRELLDAFDRAKEKTKSHKVRTQHGRTAEAAVRNWLSNFLPMKYGVTSGYIISQGMPEGVKTPHFDVIIYNKLESPVLWSDTNSDLSSDGSSRAIPAEHVQAVIEVKSSFDATSAAKAIKQLFELRPLLKEIDPVDERYKMYLPPNFFNAVIYFEDRGRQRYNKTALSKAIPRRPLRGFFGGIILRANDVQTDEALRMIFLVSKRMLVPSKGRLNPTTNKIPLSVITEVPMANHHTFSNGYHIGGMLIGGKSAFAMFAFDLLALLDGTYESGRISSQHCISGVIASEKRAIDL
jgi:hypothetical protein